MKHAAKLRIAGGVLPALNGSVAKLIAEWAPIPARVYAHDNTGRPYEVRNARTPKNHEMDPARVLPEHEWTPLGEVAYLVVVAIASTEVNVREFRVTTHDGVRFLESPEGHNVAMEGEPVRGKHRFTLYDADGDPIRTGSAEDIAGAFAILEITVVVDAAIARARAALLPEFTNY